MSLETLLPVAGLVCQRETMLTLKSAKERLQIDWLISNLRWLLLAAVATASLFHALNSSSAPLDAASLLPQIILIAFAIVYNLFVVLVLAFGVLPNVLPLLTLVIDTLLTIGFVYMSGGLQSPLMFFALFPILTAALRFPWLVSMVVFATIVTAYGLSGYILTSNSLTDTDWLSFMVITVTLFLATLVSGYAGGRVKGALTKARRLREETELRKLRAAQEHSRVIFELASTLSATLNYGRVLNAVLEVGEEGMRGLGGTNPTHVGMVLLFSHNDLRMVACRHLPTRDQNTTFEAKGGALANALAVAEPVVIDKPAEDPELGQLVAMHSCAQAIVVPLRAGFESFGVVVFGSPDENVYTRDHQDLLMAICNQAIVALQNAQLYQSLMDEKERIVDVEEDARKKLARDLHDGPTQSIAAIAMRLNYTRTLLAKNKDIQKTAEELERIEELARRTTKEIRHMLFTLRPLILETQGLQAALEQYISKLAETDSTTIHLQAIPNIDDWLDQNMQGVIFYIVEEAIGNARKHAKAQNIWVRLQHKDGAFVVEVADDGVGFDIEAMQMGYDERGSLGMINMRERAELVGGKIKLASAVGKGTRVSLIVPLDRR
jgi:signal transduction histidine kinase